LHFVGFSILLRSIAILCSQVTFWLVSASSRTVINVNLGAKLTREESKEAQLSKHLREGIYVTCRLPYARMINLCYIRRSRDFIAIK